jgi:hypothetical protein
MPRVTSTALLLACFVSVGVGGGAAAAEPPRCKGSPELAGPCFTLYGRLTVYGGEPAIRIWPDGTKKLYGVPARNGTVPLPDTLKDALAGNPLEIRGKYEMCPLEPERPNRLRNVCLESASELRVVPRN